MPDIFKTLDNCKYKQIITILVSEKVSIKRDEKSKMKGKEFHYGLSIYR